MRPACLGRTRSTRSSSARASTRSSAPRCLRAAGWSVCVLERAEVPGGCIRTSSELTLPGFTHELMASWHPLFTGSAAYAELKGDARRARRRVPQHRAADGDARPDGERGVRLTDMDAQVAELERYAAGDGAAWRASSSGDGATAARVRAARDRAVVGAGRAPRARRAAPARAPRAARVRRRARSRAPRLRSTATFASEQARGLLAPWVLHTGLGPDQAVSGFMAQVIACALQLGGMPVPRGGGVRLVEALAGIVAEGGGEVRTGADVERILVAAAARAACGSRAASGCARSARSSRASRRRALRPAARAGARARRRSRRRPGGSATAAARCRSTSRSSEPPRWRGERAADARAHADRPRHPGPGRRLARGQRGRAGPAARGGDDRRRPAVHGRPGPGARRQVDPLDPAAGAAGGPPGRRARRDRRRRRHLDEELREAYADRIVARLGAQIDEPRARDARARRALAGRPRGASTATSSAATSTRARARSTRTCCGARTAGSRTRDRRRRLWQIGASTHPGPGLGAGSGYLVAKALTAPRPLGSVPCGVCGAGSRKAVL